MALVILNMGFPQPIAVILLLIDALSIIAILAILVRCYLAHPRLHPQTRVRRRRGDPFRVLIVLGSGGHTTEMIGMLDTMDTGKYNFRTYVVGEGDTFSFNKAWEFETCLQARALDSQIDYGGFNIFTVPRARRVHQSLLTAFSSTYYSLKACVAILSGDQKALKFQRGSTHGISGPCPDLILSNGPATGAVMILAAYVLRVIDYKGITQENKLITVYVESWARLHGLSLSGKLLSYAGIVDRLLVQWRPRFQRYGIAGIVPEFEGAFVP